MSVQLYGFYSRMVAEQSGANIYMTPDRQLVFVTHCHVDRNKYSDAQYPGIIMVGLVRKYVARWECGVIKNELYSISINQGDHEEYYSRTIKNIDRKKIPTSPFDIMIVDQNQ